jgi:hypothetical protein
MKKRRLGLLLDKALFIFMCNTVLPIEKTT